MGIETISKNGWGLDHPALIEGREMERNLRLETWAWYPWSQVQERPQEEEVISCEMYAMTFLNKDREIRIIGFSTLEVLSACEQFMPRNGGKTLN